MPEVTAAAAAMHGVSNHSIGFVFSGRDGFFDRLPEARPTRAAVEFRRRGEILQIASGAGKITLPMFVQQRARERPLGSILTKDGVLVRCQQLAPLSVCVCDLEGLGGLRPGDPPRHARGRRSDRPAQQKKPSCQHDVNLRTIARRERLSSLYGEPCHIVTGITAKFFPGLMAVRSKAEAPLSPRSLSAAFVERLISEHRPGGPA